MNMNTQNIIIIACFSALFIGVILSPIIPMAVKNTMVVRAHAQTQEKFFMILKLSNPHADTYQYNTTNYDVSDISSNMNKSLGTYINKKIEFNLKNSKIGISNTLIDWLIPFTFIDTNKPNIIKS